MTNLLRTIYSACSEENFDKQFISVLFLSEDICKLNFKHVKLALENGKKKKKKYAVF